MPDRSWNPPHPTAWDRILHHPMEVVIGHFHLVAGSLLLLEVVVPGGHSPSDSLTELPGLFMAWLGLTLLLGGAGVLAGLVGWPSPRQVYRRLRGRKGGRVFKLSDDLRTRWMIERAGLGLSGLGWTSYGVAVAWQHPESVLSWGLGATFSAAFALRFIATLKVESAAAASVGRLRRGVAAAVAEQDAERHSRGEGSA